MNFYFGAAKVLDRLDAKQGSVKSLIGTIPEADRKRTTAVVIETLKYREALKEVIAQTQLLKQERKVTSLNLALVLVHDLLLAKGIQAGDGPIKQAVLRHKTRLHSDLQRLKIKRGAKSTTELAQAEDERAARIPRYVRVNTLVCNDYQAKVEFARRGFELGSDPFDSLNAFAADAHIPHLLLFHPSVRLEEDDLLMEGKIILQDKASCFPAVVLDPPAFDDALVIDATAAPGNKTSHLSALMRGKGKIIAFERDRKRFATLKTLLARARCSNVEPVNADFLTVDPSDTAYAAVSHILLDPSCSGSGIVNRLDYLLESDQPPDGGEQERLDKLAAFQLSMIKHAMKFIAVKRIVYSTCSIHATENEHVVKSALASAEARAGRFCLAPPEQVLPQWPSRGMPDEMGNAAESRCVVRCDPERDATNGFFVACFVREAETADAAMAGKKRDLAQTGHDEPKRSKMKKRKKNRAT